MWVLSFTLLLPQAPNTPPPSHRTARTIHSRAPFLFALLSHWFGRLRVLLYVHVAVFCLSLTNDVRPPLSVTVCCFCGPQRSSKAQQAWFGHKCEQSDHNQSKRNDCFFSFLESTLPHTHTHKQTSEDWIYMESRCDSMVGMKANVLPEDIKHNLPRHIHNQDIDSTFRIGTL